MSGRVTAALKRAAHVVLAVVATVGVVLSWSSLYAAAKPTFGPILAAGFPLLVDALAAGASLMYVAGARQGRGRPGWRLTAHAAIAGTVALNALAAPSIGDVPWHVTAPAVWAVLVELYGREALGDWKAAHVEAAERIPARLWLTAPVESARTWLRQGRTGVLDHAAARVDVGLHAAAGEALRLALPDRNGRRVRRVLGRQLRAGSMPPSDVLAAIGWTGSQVERTPEAVLREALRGVLAPGEVAPLDVVSESAAGGLGDDFTTPEVVSQPAPVEIPAPVRPVRVAAAARPRRRTVTAKAERRSDADLQAEIAAAIEDGRLSTPVSGNALRGLFGIGAVRAARLAEQYAN